MIACGRFHREVILPITGEWRMALVHRDNTICPAWKASLDDAQA